MGNCLKTQLKEQVNNPSLDYIDALVIEMRPSIDILYVGCYNPDNKDVIVSCVDPNDTLYDNMRSQNVGNSVTLQGQGGEVQYNLNIVSSSQKAYVKVQNFTNLYRFGYSYPTNNPWVFPLEKFERVAYSDYPVLISFAYTELRDQVISLDLFKNYKNGIKGIDAYANKNLTGNLRDMVQSNPKTIEKIENVNILVCSNIVVGTPAEIFGNCINLKSIKCAFNGGSIEEFVAAQRVALAAAGLSVSKSINFCANGGSGLTFNGSAASTADTTLSWTENTITFDGVTINA